MENLELKMQKSRVQLLLRYPFYATIVLRREFKKDTSIPYLAWTDGETIGYNPEMCGQLSVEQLTGLWAHEGSHIARKHHLRRRARNPRKWNHATDHTINLNLLDDEFKLPDGGLHDQQYRGMSADHVYTLLPDMDDDGEGDGHSGMDQVRDWPGNSDSPPNASEIEAESRQIDLEITQAASIAKKRGRLPAGMELLLEDLKNPLVDWRHLLRNYIQASAKDDHTWRRPNRRFAWQGIYLPSLYSEKIGELVVAIDTSGSTYSSQPQFLSEVFGIARELKPEKLHLLYCDAAVSAETYDNMDDLEDTQPRGGGGTSFVPVFDWVDEHNVDPVCLVYLTDMCGAFPDDAPNYPVIWVDCDGNHQAPFGDYVRLDQS